MLPVYFPASSFFSPRASRLRFEHISLVLTSCTINEAPFFFFTCKTDLEWNFLLPVETVGQFFRGKRQKRASETKVAMDLWLRIPTVFGSSNWRMPDKRLLIALSLMTRLKRTPPQTSNCSRRSPTAGRFLWTSLAHYDRFAMHILVLVFGSGRGPDIMHASPAVTRHHLPKPWLPCTCVVLKIHCAR